jgi:hypothetical protein
MQNHSEFKFFIQDEYNSWAGNKCDSTMNALKHAENSKKHENTWHLNYASGAKWPLQPPAYVAYRVKRRLDKYLTNLSKNNNVDTNESDEKINKNLGTIIIDFADRDFIKKIYMTNFSIDGKEFNNQASTCAL